MARDPQLIFPGDTATGVGFNAKPMPDFHFLTSIMRIYIDESGTHDHKWFIIGMLFVPDHGPFHAELCAAKEDLGYLNRSTKKKARYKETHLTDFRSRRDVEIAERWIELFTRHNCYFRSMVIDWSIWDGKYFGDPFESDSLKKRRAYKKWAEMLINAELKTSEGTPKFYHAKLYLDKLKILSGYDLLSHLEHRFTGNYHGESPIIESFQHADSWRDANQCLQLCDLLTGAIYQQLVPAARKVKVEARDFLITELKKLGIEGLEARYWRQYAPNTLNRHFPKFSIRFWQPESATKKKRTRRNSGGNHRRL